MLPTFPPTKETLQKSTPKTDLPNLEVPMETLAEFKNQDGEKVLNDVEEVEPVGEDAKKIPAAQEYSLSDFDEITAILIPTYDHA